MCVMMIWATSVVAQTASDAETNQSVQQAAETATATAVEVAPSPVQAGQESQAAFEEANATAKPAGEVVSAELQDGGNQTKTEPEKPSYGSFLDHQEKPKSTDIMATGDSLISSVLSTAAYMCLILGIIFLGFWLLRKFGPRGIASTGDMVNPQMVGRLMLGQKKHLDVVRVQGRTLLLGVTDENIRLLTELETQPGQCFEEDEDEDEFTNFTEMLGKQIDRNDAD